MASEISTNDLGRLWGVLRSQLSVLSVQNIRTTAGSAGFDVSQVPATSELRSKMGSRAEVLPALDKLFSGMSPESKVPVLRALARRLLEHPDTTERTQVLLEEQGFSVVGGDVEFASARSEADTDHLTELANLRGFEADLARLLSACATAHEPLALVAFDIDKFKSVNDNHGGHATGDEALVAVAQISAACVKGKGTAYRLGGDEFAIVLPNHSAQEALAVAERIRGTVTGIPLTSHQLSLSVSIGVAEFPTHGNGVAALREAADAAAYDAKSLGRNLVRLFGEPAPTGPAVPHEPERRRPEHGGLTEEQSRQIKLDYFRNHFARCPHDNAMLNVEDTTALGEKTNSIYVNCPFCGLSEDVD